MQRFGLGEGHLIGCCLVGLVGLVGRRGSGETRIAGAARLTGSPPLRAQTHRDRTVAAFLNGEET